MITAVVLLAEDVDRNKGTPAPGRHPNPSSSSRRTWIEIRPLTARTSPNPVVLLAEDVDRNRTASVTVPTP